MVPYPIVTQYRVWIVTVKARRHIDFPDSHFLVFFPPLRLSRHFVTCTHVYNDIIYFPSSMVPRVDVCRPESP